MKASEGRTATAAAAAARPSSRQIVSELVTVDVSGKHFEKVKWIRLHLRVDTHPSLLLTEDERYNEMS